MEGSRHHTGASPTVVWVVIALPAILTRAQSLGWEHYEVHEPEPHILLFKYAPTTPLNC